MEAGSFIVIVDYNLVTVKDVSKVNLHHVSSLVSSLVLWRLIADQQWVERSCISSTATSQRSAMIMDVGIKCLREDCGPPMIYDMAPEILKVVIRDIRIEIVHIYILIRTSDSSRGKDSIDFIVHLCEEETLEFF